MKEQKRLSEKKRTQALYLYLLLASLFISALVACNLIFLKFFHWTPFDDLRAYSSEGSIGRRISEYTFQISVGLLPYPITFLATDLISELYGRKKADMVVAGGLVASLFTLLIVTVANAVPAIDGSPVGDELFTQVFGLTGASVLASMLAYLFAQFIDIRLFHFWKTLTNGKKLWLRNNLSTIPSQLIDTALVLGLLCTFGALDWKIFGALFVNGFLYKVLFALIDTPLFYWTSGVACRHFGIERGKEILEI